MKDAKIRTKMLVGFGLILLLIVVLNGFSLANIRRTSNRVSQLYNGPHIDSVASVALAQELYRMESATQGMMADGSVLNHEEEYQAARQAADTDLAAFDSGDTLVAGARSALAQMDAAYEQVTQAVRRQDADAARRSLEDFRTAVSAAETAARKLSAQSNTDAEAFLEDNDSFTDRTVLIQDGIFVAIAVLCILTALRMAADIVRPVHRMEEGVAALAEGRLTDRVEVGHLDEIGMLTRQLNGSMETLGTYVGDISSVLGQIGEGNIDLEVTRDYVGDFEQIKRSLNRIIDSLNHTMEQIRTCCGQVRAGSGNLADSAEKLAQGAAEQSTALEEFQRSLGRVAELTEQDSRNAAEVKSISDEASGQVKDSTRQMELMMSSMEDINDSSNEIAKVIKIIDDIAFQTNILALNAAVEAARAGAAGKGFAVVADEVRSLANKSQEAARNTTAMIERAVSAVDGGMKNAKASSEALEQVRTLVERMAKLLVAIDQSTAEQGRAFSGMTMAVDQISAVVHANSAAAEENSVASEELSAQAELLDRLVERFRLKQGEASQPGLEE